MRTNLVIHTLIFSPYFFLMAGINFIPDGDKKMVIFCLISILFSILYFKFDYAKENIKNPVLWLCFIFCLYITTNYSIQGGSPSLLRATIASTLVMLFLPPMTSKKIILFASIGSILLFSNIIYQSFYLGHNRSAGLINVIPYATFCSVLCLTGFHFFVNNFKNRIGLLSALIIILTLATVLLTLSRGVWLALMLSIAVMSIFYFSKSNKFMNSWKNVSFILIGIIVTLFLFKTPISNRAQTTIYEIQQIQKGNLNTSIGLRLQMWKASYLIAKENLFFGVGSQHQTILKKLSKEGKVSSELGSFQPQHYHNQLIDAMVKYGLAGVSFILLLYVIPVVTSIYYNSEYIALILGISSLYFISGLTDVPLNHASTIYIYLMIIIPLAIKEKSS